MFDGINVANSGELVRMVAKAPMGKTVNIVVLAYLEPQNLAELVIIS